MAEGLKPVRAVLPSGGQHCREDAAPSGAGLGAVAAGHLAVHHCWAQIPLRAVVGRLHIFPLEEHEQGCPVLAVPLLELPGLAAAQRRPENQSRGGLQHPRSTTCEVHRRESLARPMQPQRPAEDVAQLPRPHTARTGVGFHGVGQIPHLVRQAELLLRRGRPQLGRRRVRAPDLGLLVPEKLREHRRAFGCRYQVVAGRCSAASASSGIIVATSVRERPNFYSQLCHRRSFRFPISCGRAHFTAGDHTPGRWPLISKNLGDHRGAGGRRDQVVARRGRLEDPVAPAVASHPSARFVGVGHQAGAQFPCRDGC